MLDRMHFKLKYPTIDIFGLISWVGKKTYKALLYKFDLQQVLRNLSMHQFEYPALGLTWQFHVYINFVAIWIYMG